MAHYNWVHAAVCEAGAAPSCNGGAIMPFGGNDWLALTSEPTLEPELPICDPHHHFWDFRTDRIPYQRYLLHELTADIQSGHNVRATVFIEARAMYRADGPEELRPVGEVEFVQGLAAASASGLYGPCRAAAAIIGHANLHLGDRGQPRVPRGRPDACPAGAVLGHLPVLSAAARGGGVRRGRARPAHHSQPHRWPAADRPVRQPGRRGAGRVAERHRGRGQVP